MELIDKKDSYEMIKQNYKDFGYYANATRTLASEVDGMKVVYRRTLWTALEYQKGKMVKSAVLVGAVLKLHPHGEQSGVLYSLVNSKLKIFDKQGNFGSKILAGSATRYTECRYNDNALLYLGQDLINHCEMVEGDLGYMEPRYLPALVPYILVEGNNSMGIGILSSLPTYNVIDLIEYYKSAVSGKKYKKMRIDIGSCTVNCKESEMSHYALDGKISGVRYSPKPDIEGKCIVIKELPPGMNFKKIYNIFAEAIDKEHVDYRDESNSEIRHVFEVVKGNLSDYVAKVQALSSTSSYDIVMTGSYEQEGKIVYTDMKSMRDRTINYLRDCTRRKFKSEVDKLSRKIDINKVIRFIKESGLLKELPNLTKQEIKGKIPFEESLVDAALQQSISRLMKGTTEEEIVEMEKELESLKAQLDNPDDYILKLYDDYLKVMKSQYNSKTAYLSESDDELGNSEDIRIKRGNLGDSIKLDSKGDKLNPEDNLILLTRDGWIDFLKASKIRTIDISKYIDYAIVEDTRYLIVSDDKRHAVSFDVATLGESNKRVSRTENALRLIKLEGPSYEVKGKLGSCDSDWCLFSRASKKPSEFKKEGELI